MREILAVQGSFKSCHGIPKDPISVSSSLSIHMSVIGPSWSSQQCYDISE